MSQENVETMRRFHAGPVDMVAVVAQPEALRAFLEPLVHADFELVGSPGSPPMSGGSAFEGSTRTFGVDGFLASFRDWLGAWDSWVVTATDFIDVDESRVLVILDIQARSKTHDVEMPIPAANLHTLSGGKLARMELFLDRAQALDAAGLSE